jgi:hypothetical protein
VTFSSAGGLSAGVPAVFDGLFDDAAVFPPGNVPLPQALIDHGHHRKAWYAPMVGPLVLPAARIREVTDGPGGDDVFEVSLTAKAGDAGLAASLGWAAAAKHLDLRAVELAEEARSRAPASFVDAVAAAVNDLPEEVVVYVETRSTEVMDAVLAVAGGERAWRIKLRTGGVVADAFPTEDELAGLVTGCVARAVPFKCTAGLHHAVRHTAADTGFEHHGFLNVMLAVYDAVQTRDQAAVAATLAQRDGRVLGGRLSQLGITGVAALRAPFVSLGTCSVTEPIDDLIALGLVAQPA